MSDRINKKLVIRTGGIMILCVSFLLPISAVEWQTVDPLRLKSFKTAKRFNGKGLQFVAQGASLIQDGKVLSKSSILFKKRIPSNHLKELILLWAGEGSSPLPSRFEKIILINPKGKSVSFVSEETIQTDNPQKLTTCRTDVTSVYSGPGRYRIENFKLPRPAGSKKEISVAGWCLIAVYQDTGDSIDRQIVIQEGIHVLRPLESYKMTLGKSLPGFRLSRITLIGGHGKKGNGGANFLNGKALSGGDDWDGSSGEFWDVDTFDLEPNPIPVDSGIVLTIDPLLEWIFPVAVIYQIEKNVL